MHRFFKPLLRVVRTPAGTDAAFVALCYLVNPESSGFTPLVLVAAAGLVIYWIGLVGWVFIDARARRENAALWALLVFFTNLVGSLAYLLATRRPEKNAAVESQTARAIEREQHVAETAPASGSDGPMPDR